MVIAPAGLAARIAAMMKAINWYSTATEAADRSDDPNIRVWVRGRAAIALGYEAPRCP
jgi:hypothetical protein